MTKKDYVKFAELFAILRARSADPFDDYNMAFKEVQTEVANIFERDNPRFNREWFYRACEPKKVV